MVSTKFGFFFKICHFITLQVAVLSGSSVDPICQVSRNAVFVNMRLKLPPMVR